MFKIFLAFLVLTNSLFAGPYYPIPLTKGGTGLGVCANKAVMYSAGTIFVCNTAQLSFDSSNSGLSMGSNTIYQGLDGSGRVTLFLSNAGGTFGFGTGSATLYGGVGAKGLGIETTTNATYPIMVSGAGTFPTKTLVGVATTGSASIISGSGWTVASVGTGIMNINFNENFTVDVPSCTCTAATNAANPNLCGADPLPSNTPPITGLRINTTQHGAAGVFPLTNAQFSFSCTGKI